MAITNPDSLLDKNGLAYYHSKVKQTISDASKVTVNITQSAHQTIDCYMDYPSYNWKRLIREHGSNDWSVVEKIGLDDYNWQHGNPENQVPLTESFDLKDGQVIVFRVKPDSGYKTGTLVVEGGVIEYRDGQDLIDYNNADRVQVVWCPGDVINVSATPAIEKRNITITAGSDSRDYDGTPLTNNQFFMSGNLFSGDYLSNVVVTGSQTEVGSSPNVITSFKIIRDGEPIVVSRYYNVTLVDGVLSVTAPPTPLPL